MNEMVLVINIIINHNNILMHRERGEGVRNKALVRS